MQRAQQQARLQLVPERIRQQLAQLPAPEECVEEVKLDPAHCELPALAEGAGSCTAALQQGWALYRVAREQELTLELAVERGERDLWVPVDGATLEKWQRASLARANAGRALAPMLSSVEEEHRALGVRTVALAHSLAAWCESSVEAMQTELTLQHSTAEHTIARAQALLANAEGFLEAEVQCDDIIKCMDEQLDRLYSLKDAVVFASNEVAKARERGRPTAEKETELTAAVAKLSQLLRSAAHRRENARVNELVLHQLPELVLRFPSMDPFHGTGAQGVPQRDYHYYSDVQPLFADGASVGRHELFKATWMDDDEMTHSCVLKGFDHGDQKRLHRELCVLARLRHPNILPLQAIL